NFFLCTVYSFYKDIVNLMVGNNTVLFGMYLDTIPGNTFIIKSNTFFVYDNIIFAIACKYLIHIYIILKICTTTQNTKYPAYFTTPQWCKIFIKGTKLT